MINFRHYISQDRLKGVYKTVTTTWSGIWLIFRRSQFFNEAVERAATQRHMEHLQVEAAVRASLHGAPRWETDNASRWGGGGWSSSSSASWWEGGDRWTWSSRDGWTWHSR